MIIYVYHNEYFHYGRKNPNVEYVLPDYKTTIEANTIKEAKEIFSNKYNLNPFYFTFSEKSLYINTF